MRLKALSTSCDFCLKSSGQQKSEVFEKLFLVFLQFSCLLPICLHRSTIKIISFRYYRTPQSNKYLDS